MELLILYVLLALGVSFVCSILEAVLLSVTPGFIQTQIDQKKKHAKRLSEMKSNLDKPISAILTLNTIAHTMGAAGAGAQWNYLYDNAGEAIFAGVLTFLVLVFSEIIPKTIGAKCWRSLAGPTTVLLDWMVKVLTWTGVLWILGALTRLIGGKEQGHGVSRSELAAMAELSSKSGHLEDEESEILRNLFMLKITKVRDIMTPRIVVFSRSQDMSADECLKEIANGPFSRIPIYKKDMDEVSGFVYKMDLMKAYFDGDTKGATLKKFRRPISAISSTHTVYEAFKLMTQDRLHIMMVVDEFGNLEGVVTMEDVIETLLGMEIIDEADRIEDMQQVARELWKKRARAMGIEIKDDQNVTEQLVP